MRNDKKKQIIKKWSKRNLITGSMTAITIANVMTPVFPVLARTSAIEETKGSSLVISSPVIGDFGLKSYEDELKKFNTLKDNYKKM